MFNVIISIVEKNFFHDWPLNKKYCVCCDYVNYKKMVDYHKGCANMSSYENLLFKYFEDLRNANAI